MLGLIILLAMYVPCSQAEKPGVLSPDNFSYAVGIALPLHEKVLVGSGFYYYHEKSIYVVTARHVLFAPTQVQLKEGTNLPIPPQLAYRIQYDKKGRVLSFHGVLSSKEKDEILSHPSINENGRQAIQYLYETSQKLKLKAHTATVVTCAPGTGEFELGLTRMQIRGLIKYHAAQDVAVVKIGQREVCGENTCTRFVEEVQARKPEEVMALGSTNMKLMDEVAIGSDVLLFGHVPSGAEQSSVQRRQPTLRKGSVAAKNKSLGLVVLNSAAQPGDSGGLVIGVEEDSHGKQYKGIAVMSAVFHHDREKRNAEDYSFAIALDGVIDLLKE